MKILFSRFILIISLVIPLAIAMRSEGAHAQEDSPAPAQRPFRLPFAEPPGPDTWLWGQPYGNTTGAYRQRFTTYGASGGIHFGVDLGAPCATEIVAIADGVVFAIDGPFGSPPHNLMIDHPQHGYASMYGHLLEKPNLVPGQAVKAGEVVAKVGDSGGICYRRPHLHLEIRGMDHIRKYNPSTLIEANWDSLALTGSDGRAFMRDLAEPRKWQSLYDQPEVQTGGPIVNDFAETWPMDWEKQEGGTVMTIQPVVAPLPEVAGEPLASLPYARQLTSGECCTRPYWSRIANEIRFIDQPGVGLPLGIWGVNPEQPEAGPQLVTERLALYSPNGELIIYPDRIRGMTIIERVVDGQKWEVDTGENQPSFTPDGQRLIWFESDDNGPSDNEAQTMWMADLDGGNLRKVYTMRRTNPVAWMSEAEILMSRRIPGTSDQQLFKFSVADGSESYLQDVPQMRGLALSPDRRYLVYQVTLDANAGNNGTWLLDLKTPDQSPQKLPFFGTYRWRDDQRLVYIPFDPEATEHNFYEYNVANSQARLLFPGGTGLRIANNDWFISPEGDYIVLVAAKEMKLDGIWVMPIK